MQPLSRRSFLFAAGASLVGMTSVGSFLSCWSEKAWAGKGPQISMQAAWVNDAEFLGYFVAIENGYYKNENIDFRYFPGGPDIVADTVLLSGKCDIALTTPDGTVNAIMKQKAPLKIIGTQYQKSPLGIVSLKKNKITEPKDLVGKRLAVPAANVLTTRAFLKLNQVDHNDVKFVPYTYDPRLLTSGAVDATVDFVTNVPYSIRLNKEEPTSFLFYDFGFRLFMDTVVVTDQVLRSKRKELIAFLRASRKGWEENFRDFKKYPPLFKNSWFKGNGRAMDNEIYFNEEQKPLIESVNGIFSMSESAINDNIEALKAIGLDATPEMFFTELLRDV
ncbi:MAG: ABC transporter substrate-binding protein [Pseudomonadota bacterium]